MQRFGRIDILVNNAGTSWGAPAESTPLAAWDKVMRLNAGVVFQLSQEVANRSFIPRRSGNIIVIASVAALRTQADMRTASYYASKAAAVHLTRALALEWGPYGIRVNAICPGFFPSKLSDGLLESIEASVIERTPARAARQRRRLHRRGRLSCVGRVAARDRRGSLHRRRSLARVGVCGKLARSMR